MVGTNVGDVRVENAENLQAFTIHRLRWNS
jgi:hypothetical protein